MAKKSRKNGRKHQKGLDSKFNHREQLANQRHKTRKKTWKEPNKIFKKCLKAKTLFPFFFLFMLFLVFGEHSGYIIGLIVKFKDYYDSVNDIAKFLGLFK